MDTSNSADFCHGLLGDYTLNETTARGEANQMQGSSTIVYSKSGTALKAVLIQLSVNRPAITPYSDLPFTASGIQN